MSANKNNTNTNKPNPHGPKKGKAGMWFLLILIIAGIVGAGFWATTQMNTTTVSTSGTYVVGKGQLTVTVTEAGSIRAQNSVRYVCEVERNRDLQDISIISIVPNGTVITQTDVDNGKVLVELDSSVLEDRLIQEKLSLTSDEERVTSAEESFQIQLIENQSSISNSELRVRFALLDLQKYLGAELANSLIVDVNQMLPAVDSNEVVNGSEKIVLSNLVRPLVQQIKEDPNILSGSSAWQQLKSRQDDIVIAEGNLKTQQDTVAGTVRLHDANYVSDLELQRDKLTLKSREFSLQNSQINLALFLDYDFPKSAEQSLSDYIEARRSLQRTYAQCRSREAQAKSSLSSAILRRDEQQKQVQLLEKQIAHCIIKAKKPGLVVYGEGSSSDRARMMRGGRGGSMGGSGIIAEGESVYEGQTIISMPDTSSMVAEVGVHETQVNLVGPGQKATIIMDAIPDQIFEGEVLEVAPLPDQSQSYLNPDAKVYQTIVKINGTHTNLKSLMNCKVNILVEKLDDVVLVPVQVVANRLGRKICYVVNSSGEPEEREVVTGSFNETQVQIIRGLEAGETVLLNPLPFTDSAAASFQSLPPTPQGPATRDPNQAFPRGNRGGMGGTMPGGGGQGMGGNFGGARGGGGNRGGGMGGQRMGGGTGQMPQGGFGGAGAGAGMGTRRGDTQE